MARKQSGESNEARLKKKITEKLANHSNPEADAAMRSLRKRLKRAAFFDAREERVAAGRAERVDNDAGLPENVANDASPPPRERELELA